MNQTYVRFERLIAVLLTVGMAVVIVFATVYFILGLVEVLFNVGLEANYVTFQDLFERVLAAVIALELARSVQEMAAGKHGLTQVRTVVLIGILAVVRKLIVLDIDKTDGVFLLGLAAAILTLGAVYAMTVLVEQQREEPLKAPLPGAADSGEE